MNQTRPEEGSNIGLRAGGSLFWRNKDQPCLKRTVAASIVAAPSVKGVFSKWVNCVADCWIHCHVIALICGIEMLRWTIWGGRRHLSPTNPSRRT